MALEPTGQVLWQGCNTHDVVRFKIWYGSCRLVGLACICYCKQKQTVLSSDDWVLWAVRYRTALVFVDSYVSSDNVGCILLRM